MRKESHKCSVYSPYIVRKPTILHCKLSSPLQNVASFCSDAESKLMNLLRRNLLLTPSLTKRCGLESPSPSRSFAEDKSSVSFW